MYRMKSWGLYIRLLWPVWHGLIVSCIFWLVYKIRLVTDLIPGLQLRIPPIDTQELLIFAIFSVVAFVVIGGLVQAYRFHFGLEVDRNAYIKQWFFWLVAMTFVAYFGHGFVFVSGISRFILLWTALLSGIVVSLFDRGYSYVVRKIEQQNPQRILCVYQDESQRELLRNHVPLWYEIDALHADQWDLVEYSDYHEVVVMGEYSKGKLQREFDKVRLAHHTMYHIGDSHFLDNVVYRPARVGSLNAYRYTPSRLHEWMRLVKRLVDLLVSISGLIFLSPLFLLISVVIWTDSRGGVLYRQQRIGKNGRVFTINKFRTMYTHLSVGQGYGGDEAWKLKEELMESDANVRKGELQKIDNDPRVTRVGRFFRRTSLDELPSLWNVLIGEMSLVGPRPHEVFEVERYKSWQKRLLSMKPGITGYAQIKGRDSLSFDDEANFDLYYMEHWSLWLDVYVMVMTVGVVMKGR